MLRIPCALKARAALLALLGLAALTPAPAHAAADPWDALILWRHLAAPDSVVAAGPESVRAILAAGDTLFSGEESGRAFRLTVLPGLPRLETELRRRLALLAQAAGVQDAAQRHFLAYLRLAPAAPREGPEQRLLDSLLAAEETTNDELRLWRAEVLRSQGSYSAAESLLLSLRAGAAGELRARAGLRLATLWRVQGKPRADVEKLLAAVQAEAPGLGAAEEAQAGREEWWRQDYYRDAVKLIATGGQRDALRAESLLTALLADSGAATYWQPARFWYARLAEARGDAALAEREFRETVAHSPWGWYALRSRLHLRYGAQATTMLELDVASRGELHGAWTELPAPVDPGFEERVLRAAAGCGDWAAALMAAQAARRAFPDRRQDSLDPQELDDAGCLNGLVALLAFRQMALRVAEDPSARVRVCRLAAEVGDLALATALAVGIGADATQRAATERAPGFLAAAYPPVFAAEIRAAAAGHGVPPALLYAVMRRESLFAVEALSWAGALGLFQFTPWTFRALDRQWGLLATSGRPSREAYLLDASLSIDLGARWFAEELLPRQRGHLARAVMEHNAGAPAVQSWRDYWRSIGCEEDLELTIELIQYTETRRFLRDVMADYTIMEALGVFPNAQ